MLSLLFWFMSYDRPWHPHIWRKIGSSQSWKRKHACTCREMQSGDHFFGRSWRSHLFIRQSTGEGGISFRFFTKPIFQWNTKLFNAGVGNIYLVADNNNLRIFYSSMDIPSDDTTRRASSAARGRRTIFETRTKWWRSYGACSSRRSEAHRQQSGVIYTRRGMRCPRSSRAATSSTVSLEDCVILCTKVQVR